MTLSNFQISDILKYFQIDLISVFMKDELTFNPYIGNYIINLDSSTDGRNGTHWTVLILTKDVALYFDSFGCVPPQGAADFIRKKYKVHSFNNEIIQNINSDNCGFFCIALLIYLKTHSDLNIYDAANGYINLFKSDTTKNDEILFNYFKSLGTPKKILNKISK